MTLYHVTYHCAQLLIERKTEGLLGAGSKERCDEYYCQ